MVVVVMMVVVVVTSDCGKNIVFHVYLNYN
jgi:hypothetical protein